jgi:hypothetical protein
MAVGRLFSQLILILLCQIEKEWSIDSRRIFFDVMLPGGSVPRVTHPGPVPKNPGDVRLLTTSTAARGNKPIFQAAEIMAGKIFSK